MRLHVYTLEGCKYCESLLAELKALGIHYVNRDAEDYSIEADSLERFTGTTLYPIVHLVKGTDNIIFATYDTGEEVKSNVTLYYSIPNLVELIKKHI